jgi:hypothetical protein
MGGIQFDVQREIEEDVLRSRAQSLEMHQA